MLKIKKTTRKVMTQSFPIVGIGASAGGLESIEQLFSSMPVNSGAAFIIITHLARTHVSIMPELIKKYTKMQVVSIIDGLKVKPNIVYVISPNTTVTIKKGIIHLIKRKDTNSNLPVNCFFQSLAKDKGKDCVGIILSGSGSDGTDGIKAISQEGGITIAQDPLTAKYDGMPRSAVNTGLIDYILPLEKISDQLIKCMHFGELKGKVSPELQQIFMMLRAHTGHDFSSYKLNTIYRRIEKQMQINHINTLSSYVKFLDTHPHEMKVLFNNLLIGVTRFFRDEDVFEVLKKIIIEKILKNKSDDYCIRIWIPGCSTGEEAYSIAILMRECLDELKSYCKVQIFGTDIDLTALDVARAAVYSHSVTNEISPERLKQFFIKEKDTYKIKKEIREMVIFGMQNIIKDPPFTRLDMICCRNLLIYFNSQLQKKLFPIFHYSLNPNGLLFLGSAETITGYNNKFNLVSKKGKIYERKDGVSGYTAFNYAISDIENNYIFAQNGIKNKKIKQGLIESINHFLIEKYFPVCLLINKKGEILNNYGRVGYYLGLNKTINSGVNVFDLIPAKIKTKLKTAIRKAHQKRTTIDYPDFPAEKRGNKTINLKIMPVIESNENCELLFICFEENIKSTNSKEVRDKHNSVISMRKKILLMEDELQYTKENLQATVEEMQSSNEELQSTNEELQSTNEEIETSKEELQSLNEELVSVNTELQNKIDQLSSLNDDMNNLFNSTEVAAIFLDNDLNIKRFTPKVQELIHLIQSDIGRSISHFATNIKYETLVTDAKEVLKTLVPQSFEVRSRNHKSYLVKILPYRTLLNMIDGVIITFSDITKHIEAEKKLHKLNNELNDSVLFTKSIIDTVSEPMLILSVDLKIISANLAFYQFFKIASQTIVGQFLYSIDHAAWNIPHLRQKLENVTKKKIALKSFEITQEFPKIGSKNLLLYAFRILKEELDTNTLLLLIKEK